MSGGPVYCTYKSNNKTYDTVIGINIAGGYNDHSYELNEGLRLTSAYLKFILDNKYLLCN